MCKVRRLSMWAEMKIVLTVYTCGEAKCAEIKMIVLGRVVICVQLYSAQSFNMPAVLKYEIR